MRRHKIKTERRDSDPYKDRDLAHYLHDRVALLRQAMSLIKHRELKAMTPSGLRGIPDRHLQELCLEELLGISSKRLCAVLDGAEPPTDTDSSSQSGADGLETISLDSISSDEAVLNPVVEKSKKKRKQHKHKTKQKSSHHEDKQSKGHQESIAGRAGMTVLELLELQARARAIRAQLAADGARGKKTGAEVVDDSADDDDVQIKEEEPEVVELSSDEDKPNVRELEAAVRQHSNKKQEVTKTVVKTSNNLTVIVPQKQTRKIKLNRHKVAPATTLTQNSKTTDTTNSKQDKPLTVTITTVTVPDKVPKTTKKVKQKAKKNRGVVNDKAKDGSDHDEITLQLSDSEKMDLLEEFEKQSDDTSSSDEEDSEEDSSDSESSSRNTQSDKIPIETTKFNDNVISKEPKVSEVPDASVDVTEVNGDTELYSVITEQTSEECHKVATDNKISPAHNVENVSSSDVIGHEQDNDKCVEESPRPSIEKSGNPVIEVSCIEDIPIQSSDDTKIDTSLIENCSNNLTASNESHADPTNDNNDQVPAGKSEGEVSDRSSSEVESTVMQPEVVCISDEDTDKTGKNQKKKKDKKSKKEKKNKRKKSDFREVSDQNFYKDNDSVGVGPSKCHDLTEACDLKTENTFSIKSSIIEIDIDSDNVYEVLEISDDSSCYEVEGISVLSKEPTCEEIEALSAKIDHEIEREVVATDEHIMEHDNDTDKQLETEEDAVANISWKDRYLRSTKVKRVLTTANILNALRKKNKELKKKLEESKTTVPEIVETPAEVEKDKEEENNVEVGSIEHFNTLQGSTTYVDPVKEVVPEKEKDLGDQMKKDAKKLLKMYKRLLKYNDMEKKKDPSKPKKKKTKKHKKSKNNDANNTVTL